MLNNDVYIIKFEMRGKFMKYYVVAVFDEDSYKNFSYTQKNLSKRFRGNRNSPTPYIPLEAIENPNLEKLELVIEKLIKPYKLFKVRLTNEILPIDNNKTLNIKITDYGYIKRLNRIISDTLKLHGFNVLDFNSDSLMYLSVANLNFIPKDMTYKCVCETLKVDRIEIWKLSNNKKETVIKSYPLKKNLAI